MLARNNHRGTAVTVNSVLPGLTRTGGLGTVMDTVSEQRGMPRAALEDGFFSQGRPSSLVQRFLSPDESSSPATFRALSIEGTFSDEDLAAYAAAYRGRDRLRGGFAHYRTLLTDGAENRRLLAAGPVRTPVLVVGAGAHGATDPAAALRAHATDVTGAVAVAEEAPEWLVTELRRFLGEHQG